MNASLRLFAALALAMSAPVAAAENELTAEEKTAGDHGHKVWYRNVKLLELQP